MTYSHEPADLPQGWKVKIFAKERNEDPHVTILRRTEKWRYDLRHRRFMDPRPKPAEVPPDIVRIIARDWDRLRIEWNHLHGHLNPL